MVKTRFVAKVAGQQFFDGLYNLPAAVYRVFVNDIGTHTTFCGGHVMRRILKSMVKTRFVEKHDSSQNFDKN